MTRIQFKYKNHHNKIELRSIELLSLDFVPMPNPVYGYGPGWFLHGKDFTVRDGVARTGEPRSFALNNIIMEDYYAPPQGQIGTAFRLPMKGESILEFLLWATVQQQSVTIGAEHEVPIALDALERFNDRFKSPGSMTLVSNNGGVRVDLTKGQFEFPNGMTEG